MLQTWETKLMISRRKFLALGALALPAFGTIDARLVEPTRVRVTNLKANASGKRRFVHFSDLHYAGDRHYAAKVVETINRLEADFACFTGDLMEDKAFLPETLSFIQANKSPGLWSSRQSRLLERRLLPGMRDALLPPPAAPGWWIEASFSPQYDLELVGMALRGIHAFKPAQAARRILLNHYPAMADRLGMKFDLILSGHSHGGQIRLPFYGPLLIPYGVGPYDLGFFETANGPLYVNAGIGTLVSVPWRFNCRPEITVVTI